MFGKLVIYDMFPNIIKLPSNDMEHALDSKKTHLNRCTRLKTAGFNDEQTKKIFINFRSNLKQ